MQRGKCRILIVVGFALASCACDGITTSTPTVPTTPDAEPTIVESWTGTVPVGGASFYSFGVSQRGTVQVTLQSVGGQTAPTVTLGLALGSPAASSCTATGVVNAQAGSTPQLTGTYNAGLYLHQRHGRGEYCRSDLLRGHHRAPVTGMRFRASVRVVLAVATIAAACGDSAPTSPSPVTGEAAQLFSGTLPVGGSSFYSFTVSQAGTVEFTLASVSLDNRGSTLTTAVGLATGTPNGTQCDTTNSVTTQPGLKVQLRTALGPGTYCARVFDVGNLTASVNFTVRIVHVVNPTLVFPGSPTTETFASVRQTAGSRRMHSWRRPPGRSA